MSFETSYVEPLSPSDVFKKVIKVHGRNIPKSKLKELDPESFNKLQRSDELHFLRDEMGPDYTNELPKPVRKQGIASGTEIPAGFSEILSVFNTLVSIAEGIGQSQKFQKGFTSFNTIITKIREGSSWGESWGSYKKVGSRHPSIHYSPALVKVAYLEFARSRLAGDGLLKMEQEISNYFHSNGVK